MKAKLKNIHFWLVRNENISMYQTHAEISQGEKNNEK